VICVQSWVLNYMKKITDKEYKVYEQYKKDLFYGRIITPDGLRIICAGLDNDSNQIGKFMLEKVNEFKNKGIIQ